jgi:hypothetical protein
MRTTLKSYSRVIFPILFPAFVSLSLGCGGAESDPSSGQVGRTASAIYGGETLLRGIFFGTGEIAEKLPEMWKAPEQTQQGVLTPEQTASRLEAAAKQLRASGYDGQASKLVTLADQVRSGTLSPSDVARLSDSKYSVANRASPEAIATHDRIVSAIKTMDPGFLNRFAVEIQSGDQVRVAAAIREGSRILMNASNLSPAGGTKRPTAICQDCPGGGPGGGGGGDPSFIVGPIATLVAVFAIAVLVVVAFWGEAPDDPNNQLERDLWIDAITHRFAA